MNRVRPAQVATATFPSGVAVATTAGFQSLTDGLVTTTRPSVAPTATAGARR